LHPAAEAAAAGDAGWQGARFAEAAKGRYLCLEAVDSQGGGAQAAISELDVTGPNGESLAKARWKVLWADGGSTAGSEAENMIDGQAASFWQTSQGRPYPHRVVLDLGESVPVGGLRFLSGAGTERKGAIRNFRVYLGESPFGLTP
jgi:beta-galactosidase